MVKHTHAINRFKSSHFFPILIGIGIFLTLATAFFIIRTSFLSSNIINKTGKKLLGTATERKKNILDFIESQRLKVAQFSGNERIISLSQSLLKAYSPGTKGDYKATSDEYKQFEKEFDQFLNQQNSIYEFKDIMLINSEGMVFYTFKNDLLNLDLKNQKNRASALAESFERTRMTLTTDVSEFSTDPELNVPALYMLRPLFDKQQFVGILAIQIDESLFYKIIQNYDGLGKTGDIFVTKNISDRVIFVAPSRLYSDVSFKKITDPSKEENTPTRLGTTGNTGYGYLIDAYNTPVVAAWTFVPQINVGLSIGIQYVEVAAFIWWYKLLSWLFGILLILYLLAIAHIMGSFAYLRPIKNFIYSCAFLKIVLWFLTLGMLLISGLIFWYRYSTYHQIVQQTTRTAEVKVHTQAESIKQNLLEIEKIAEQIARDLKLGTLKQDDIQIRILRDLKEVADLEDITIAFAPFAHDSQTRLYGFESKKIDGQSQANIITYDYMVPGASDLVESDWYNRTIKDGAGWSAPYYGDNKISKVVYTLPFYLPSKSEPAGVIAITYNLGKMVEGIKNLEIGKLGYGLLLTSTGVLVYHPLEHYLKNKSSLFDIARENNNQDLKDIAQKITTQDKGVWSYVDPLVNTTYWLVSENISGINWRVVGIFSNESLPLPIQKLRKQLIWGIVTLILGLLLGAMLVARVWEGLRAIRKWAFLAGGILAATLIIFWNLTHVTPYEPRDDIVVVRDQTGLDKFIDLVDIETQQRNEKRPITIPTGIILYNVTFPDSNRVSVSGYIWQKINKATGANFGVVFPEASESSFKEIFRKEENGIETVGWNIFATFTQKHTYSFFPFDKVHIDILLATSDFERHVILTPDFSGYKAYDVDPLPGVSNEIAIPGYTLERSFFSFVSIPTYDEVGLDALRKVTEKVRLHYNIILKRKLINPLIIFMLPLLIILFSIFAVFLVTRRTGGKFDAFKSIGAYTGLFFSLVILHQTLRSQVQSGELLYIEYFFFFTYVTILLLVLHSLLLRISGRANTLSEKISPYLKIMFWPLQFALWFAVTMIIFYTLR